MPPLRPGRPLPWRLSAALVLFVALVLAVVADAAETVILKDGFVIQGNVRKEFTTINDPATGRTFPIAKDNGFDMIDEGPKVVIFSTHAKQVGEVSKDVKLRPEYRAFTMPGGPRRRNDPLPVGAVTKSSTEFNDNWVRTITVRVPLGIDKIDQQVTYIDPYFTYMWSSTHIWRVGYRTTELEPAKLRRLLKSHPELRESDGKPDPLKRLALVKFWLDAGWLALAKEDLEDFRKTFGGGLGKQAQEEYDRLVREIDTATAALVIKEAELALNAGRYTRAGELLSAFPEKLAEPRQTEEATKLMAQWKTVRERYDTGRRLLRRTIDELTGKAGAESLLAVGGGGAMTAWPVKKLSGVAADLADAAEEVYVSLHPDSVQRIEFFVNLAAQVEREKGQGRDPSKRPEELLATAVSGWVRGKNGATADPELARRYWNARETVLAYQRTEDLNGRNRLLASFHAAKPLPIDELGQIISLLPPAEPEDLLFRTGTPVPALKGVPPGIYRRVTRPTPNHLSGIPYQVKLPPEYHHGRAYPVLIVLTHPSIDPEQMIASLAHESDRHGYILLAPEWSNQFGLGWRWRGEDHEFVTAVLADAVRHFCVDNDRVFLFGAADGGNAALDIGLSHPDLFAGVLAMGPVPKWQNMFMHYWPNAQKLPCYIVTGEMAGESAANLRRIFEQWMPRGYPGLLVVYKGRGLEWFGAEPPVMFDWMNRKKRVNGTATLHLGSSRQPWTTMRHTDNRFYWLGVDQIAERNLMDNNLNRTFVPAEIQGDINGNRISITTRGVLRFSVWLSQDMIDWSKPVAVNLNRQTAPGWKAKVIEPDLVTLLEDYRLRGDRRMLYLKRLEFSAIP